MTKNQKRKGKKSKISDQDRLVKARKAILTRARFESLGAATQSDPSISSITYCDHKYLFELPRSRERGAQSLHR